MEKKPRVSWSEDINTYHPLLVSQEPTQPVLLLTLGVVCKDLSMSESLFRSLIEIDTRVIHPSINVLAWYIDPNGIKTNNIL